MTSQEMKSVTSKVYYWDLPARKDDTHMLSVYTKRSCAHQFTVIHLLCKHASTALPLPSSVDRSAISSTSQVSQFSLGVVYYIECYASRS